MSEPDAPPPQRQPIFNLPDVVVVLIAILVGIHSFATICSAPISISNSCSTFAFIPARITVRASADALPGGEGAAIWSFLTYALLHADWGHLGINCLWLAAFGSPLARRFGAARFLLFSAIGAVGGAFLHLACPSRARMSPLIGASAAISAHMAGASRFVFGERRAASRMAMGSEAYRRPAQPLLGHSSATAGWSMFVAVWFGLNLVFGLLGAGERPRLRRDRLGGACRRLRRRPAALSAVRSDPGCRAGRPSLTATPCCSAY